MDNPVSRLIMELGDELSDLNRFFFDSPWVRGRHLPTANDFAVGNPQEMPVPGIAEAIAKAAVPQDKDWFAYKISEDKARAAAADGLARTHSGLGFTEADITMTNGAFAGIAVALRAVVDAGDEVIYQSPPWFFYTPIIRMTGAVPVKVKVKADDFDLDLQAIAAAITPRTRVVIVNSPNNPTGRIYPASTLAELGKLLEEASARNGRDIYLLSDESYSRILYDGVTFESPAAHYDRSFLIYTYGKQLLAPGLRVGYIALRPDMPNKDVVALALFMAATILGWSFPVSVVQEALPDLEAMSIDLAHLQKKRDRIVTGLKDAGYELHAPEGTFYLMPKSPIEDDWEFMERLGKKEVYVLPGKLVDLPGSFRISLTASDEMIDRALPVFAASS
jgi:aspartate aminotransferase